MFVIEAGGAYRLQQMYIDRARMNAQRTFRHDLDRTVDDGLVLRFTARLDKKDDPRLKAFIQVFNSPEVKKFIENKLPAFIPAGFSS